MPPGGINPPFKTTNAGQILALAAQAVGDPRPVARPALQAAAGVQEIVRACVLREIRDHRPHDGELVDARSDPRKQVADRDAALAVPAKLPGAAEHVAHVVELSRMGLDLDRLPVLAIEPGLGVERVDLRRPAVHEQEDDARGLGRKLRGPGAPAGSLSACALRLGLGAVAQDRAEGRIAKERRRPPAHRNRCRTARAYRGG